MSEQLYSPTGVRAPTAFLVPRSALLGNRIHNIPHSVGSNVKVPQRAETIFSQACICNASAYLHLDFVRSKYLYEINCKHITDVCYIYLPISELVRLWTFIAVYKQRYPNLQTSCSHRSMPVGKGKVISLPWKCMGRGGIAPSFLMEVSGQHHTSAALPPGKEAPVTHCTGGWAGPRPALEAVQ
jgi:hypothetical protein